MRLYTCRQIGERLVEAYFASNCASPLASICRVVDEGPLLSTLPNKVVDK
jgi:hypothetical protein